jgi:hypothetical protein
VVEVVLVDVEVDVEVDDDEVVVDGAGLWLTLPGPVG